MLRSVRLSLATAALVLLSAPASATTLSGTLVITVADHFDPDASEDTHFAVTTYELNFGGVMIPLTFDPLPTTPLIGGQPYEITGEYDEDGGFEVSSYDDGISSQGLGYAECSAKTGARKVLAILVNLPDYTLPAGATVEHVKGVLLGNDYTTADNTPNWSVSDFWTQNSDGQMTINTSATTVLGPYSLNSNFVSTGGVCQSSAMMSAALAAAAPHTDVSSFHHVTLIWPGNGITDGDCGAAGFANTHCEYIDTPDGATYMMRSWIRGSKMLSRQRGVQLLTHELGHNLGIHHGSKRDFGSIPLGDIGVLGSIGEYGSKFDTMGAWNFGFYSAPNTISKLGWLVPTTNFTTVESNGSYSIDNYEKRPASVKALKVRRGSNNDAWLYVEYRADTGLYSSELDAQVHSGALLHFDDGQFTRSPTETHLLDFNAGTTSWSDPALELNEEWNDPYSNLVLKVTALSANSLTLEVTYDAQGTCTRATPTVSLNPSSDSTAAGQTSTTVATVTNNNNAHCGPEQFGITAQKWTGWTRTFSPGSTITLASGASTNVAINYTSPSTEPPGTRQSTIRAKGKTSLLQSPTSNKFSITTP